MPFHLLVGSIIKSSSYWCENLSLLGLTFFFFSCFLSPPWNYNLVLFVVCISTSVFIFFLIVFLSPFIEVLLVFNFVFQSQFVMYYFSNLILTVLILFFFGGSFVKLIFFFNFDPYSFDCFFVLSLNWFFFSISPFN